MKIEIEILDDFPQSRNAPATLTTSRRETTNANNS
jgi:hypothetical protein